MTTWLADRFASLTSRLVITAVLLVAVVSLLVGTTTALAMRSYLTNQLDTDVRQSLRFAGGVPPDDLGAPRGGVDGGIRGARALNRGQQVKSVTAYFSSDGRSAGFVLTENSESRAAVPEQLSDEDLATLDAVPSDGQVHDVNLADLGEYRVMVDEGTQQSVVSGLPTEDIDETVGSLIRVELILALLGTLLAAIAGRFVVRRQLRPLTEVAETAHSVAELPLASGVIGITERVPEHLTDEATEVGRVGAALNKLLAHVESSLDARHTSEQRVRQFVADASHELRTPLTTIAGYAELARRHPDDAAAGALALAKVEEESARMTALVEDLLLLARLDSGRPLEREDVDLTRLLVEAVSDARVLAPDHHWRLDLPEEAVELPGDALRLHQVVTNLLTNARKYTAPGTTVTVSARADGFSVHDDGPGFPPEVAPHAFERFARGDTGRHREGGVGLGLALVQAIVTAHGGTVRLTTAPGDTRIDVQLG